MTACSVASKLFPVWTTTSYCVLFFWESKGVWIVWQLPNLDESDGSSLDSARGQRTRKLGGLPNVFLSTWTKSFALGVSFTALYSLPSSVLHTDPGEKRGDLSIGKITRFADWNRQVPPKRSWFAVQRRSLLNLGTSCKTLLNSKQNNNSFKLIRWCWFVQKTRGVSGGKLKTLISEY